MNTEKRNKIRQLEVKFKYALNLSAKYAESFEFKKAIEYRDIARILDRRIQVLEMQS